MSERILVPLDGSKLGEAALAYIQGLIARLGPGEQVALTLLNVITAEWHTVNLRGGEMVSVPYTDRELGEMKKSARIYLENVSAGLTQKNVSISCQVSVSENPAEEIIRVEKEIDADLVAMSTHGRSGLSRFAFGSVADKVMRGGSVPVLMVRAKEK
ncbi:universal stress protein [Desulforhopalus singaporensis]|uniref:Nucleotide-binding universal stress protein, UspA family n=1 Tax=Desulforhopalus singaporensis TaxID=91360 RepID=A0A1H0TMF9_9BACT|nr:universal stress protein [Desulforhopalus singaporensis]SDP54716.1 Nucleotide-binding universal stress protein, UspA family [Desulforhopalus singaporensis]